MGIKHYFIWLRNNFEECLKTVTSNETLDKLDEPVIIENLCLDLNGIFHNSTQRIYEYGAYKPKQRSLLIKRRKMGMKWQLKVFEEICNQIEFYRKKVNPTKRLILCVDGVPGLAKISQQRQRRFKSVLDLDDDTSFYPNNITCGTRWMDHLTKYIDWYIRKMITDNEDWQKLEIIFSNEKVPGEGEHSILNFIRSNKKKLNVNDNDNDINDESYLIQGADADLIMLALGSLCKKIYILRENTHFVNKNESFLVDINHLSKLLNERLKWDSEDPNKFKYNKNNAIDDFIFMDFLVGNDFVPNIPTLSILEGGIDKMINIYKETCKSYGHLVKYNSTNDSITFSIQALKVFLGTLASLEKEILQDKLQNKKLYFEDKILEKYAHELPLDDDGIVKYNLDFDKYRELYYEKKFNNVSIESICNEYLHGLQWILTYYKKGIPDWEWFFPEFYGPFLCDLFNYCNTEITHFTTKSKDTNNITPFLQLLTVLPPLSANLLPEPLDKLITADNSPIKEFYPDTFEVDVSGKRREWEGIVNLPMVDINKLREVYDKYITKVDRNELKRNKFGLIFKYLYVEGIDKFLFKSYYSDILISVKIESIKFD